MKLLIVVHHRFDLWNVPGWFLINLARDFSSIDIVHRDSYEGIDSDLREAEIIFTFSLRPEQFAAAKHLRWIHAATAAVHQFQYPSLTESGVILTNSREVHGLVVAEHVMALIFALAKKIPQAVRLQQKRTWGQTEIWNSAVHPRDLAGSTLGLIGLGSIGSRVAQMAHASGMRIVAVRQHVEKERLPGVEEVFSFANLDALLRQSDFVVVAAPLTTDTQGLINEQRLAAMKPSAYLINVGRGPEIDEVALADALRNAQIAGAALDVFEKEPLPEDSPLWDLENLLITPHTAGLSENLWRRHYDLFSDNLRRYLSKQPLRFVVDKRAGY